MQTYSKFRPTGFDPAGAFLEDDRQDWLVLSVSQTRDSGPLDQSNFETAQVILTDGREDPEDFETHRFGHWGPGWFEIIIVKPGSRAAELAEEIEAAMKSYPVLDEQDYSDRQWSEFEESWNSWGARDLAHELAKQFGLSDLSSELLKDADKDALRQWWMDCANEPYSEDSGGVYIPIRREVERFERSDVAQLLRTIRAAR